MGCVQLNFIPCPVPLLQCRRGKASEQVECSALAEKGAGFCSQCGSLALYGEGRDFDGQGLTLGLETCTCELKGWISLHCAVSPYQLPHPSCGDHVFGD